MKGVYLADVGDGLCVAIHTIFGDIVQIDCGGQGSEVALNGLKRIFNYFHNSLDVFILSHFHFDHYNGLLYASIKHNKHPFLNLREVYYPRIPDFNEKEEFTAALFAMNLRLLGSETGVMEYDFLRAVSKLNKATFKYKPVSKGDVIGVNGSFFEVLWPPAVMNKQGTLRIIRRALEDFKKAKEEDWEIAQFYELVVKEGHFKAYIGDRGEKNDFKEYKGMDFEEYKGMDLNPEYKKRELPQVVKRANKSLITAANHLSLALFEDNRFLFLGDVENSEIKDIGDELKSKGRQNFYIFITPHHGTHWNKTLEEIKSSYSLISNGNKLYSKMKRNFKETSGRSLATYVNGDIAIPIYPIGRFWQSLPWW